MKPRATSFRTIRTWNGTQHRAFEELSYQLLKEEVPEGSVAIRTGNPDGGVEWFAKLPEGTEVGWQAKFIFEIDSLLNAMTESVRAIVQERPKLKSLTFVIPINLAARKNGRSLKSQRDKYDDKIEFWKKSIPGADEIVFHLIQESDLLARLSVSQHRSRRWFWWDEVVLDLQWCRDFHKRQAELAGRKYRPELQVDLPINEDLRGLSGSSSLERQYLDLRKNVLRERIWNPQLKSEIPGVTDVWLAASELFTDLSERINNLESIRNRLQSLDALEEPIAALLPMIWRLERECFRQRDEAEGAAKNDTASPSNDSEELIKLFNDLIGRCRSIEAPIQDLSSWLRSTPVKAARRRLYFLEGPAGCGKTHLLLDAAREVLGEARPALFFHGFNFEGDLWASMGTQMGIGPLGRDELLGALESTAEASGFGIPRLTILIDALNETREHGYWERNLPNLLVATTECPFLTLAVSCRDTYVDVADPQGQRSKFLCVGHPGFAGREVEATHKYFEHYGLETPRIPLLTPEFTVPLFLRLYCEGIADGEGSAAALGHLGRVDIFTKYLETKVKQVALRSFPNVQSDLQLARNQDRIREALNSLIDALANSESIWLDLDEAVLAISRATGVDEDRALAIVGILANEGVISQGVSYFPRITGSQGVQFAFQAFSDFLILRRRLEIAEGFPTNGPFLGWLQQDASWGIVEAAAIAIPELYRIELPDLLGLDIDQAGEGHEQTDEEQDAAHFTREVFRVLATSLPYRSSSSISDRTTELVNLALASGNVRINLFDILFALAPQPDNPLNADRLHRNLQGLPMPERDSWFGFEVYESIWNEIGPIARLARWAAFGPYPDYPPEVIRLSATALTWLLSSPNRYMRDWVTKALVQLLHRDLTVVGDLFNSFWEVNDPYIVQRVVAIAYGCLMRGGDWDTEGSRALSQLILDKVFAHPMRADELLIDSARGSVEWAVSRHLLPLACLAKVQRPYGFKTIGYPPTWKRLEKRYEPRGRERQPPSESYSTIWSSLSEFGDFGRYVVGSGMDHFSARRIGQTQVHGNGNNARLNERKWDKFCKTLSATQAAHLGKLLNSGEETPEQTEARVSKFRESLTSRQSALLAECWTPLKSPTNFRFSGDLARRWVFCRTLALGWTPSRFGEVDAIKSHRNWDRDGHKAERWGKKYQWMAYHELLARVADNYQTFSWNDEEEPYSGLQQLIGDRELDPSLPPIDFRAMVENAGKDTSTWGSTPYLSHDDLHSKIDICAYHKNVRQFAEDNTNYPLAERIALATDTSGDEWVSLFAYEVQSDSRNEPDDKRIQQQFWINSAFVPIRGAKDRATSLLNIWREDPNDFIGHGHTDCCFAGEIGWSPRICGYSARTAHEVGRSSSMVSVIDPYETYTWEGSLQDCSIGESVHATLPSSFVVERSDLRMISAGPSWLDANGEAAAIYFDAGTSPWTGDYWHFFFMKRQWMERFLIENALALVVVSRFERFMMDSQNTWKHPHCDGWSGVLLDHDGRLRSLGNPRIRLNPYTCD